MTHYAGEIRPGHQAKVRRQPEVCQGFLTIAAERISVYDEERMWGETQTWLLAMNALLAALALLAGVAWWRGRTRRRELERRQTEFVAAVSHEFRSPLTTIRHLTDLLAQDRLPGEEMRKRCLGHIEKETERLNTLVEDLLDFGRIETRRKTYHREAADVGEVVRQAVVEFQEDPESVGHFFNTERVTAGLWSVVDAGAIRRALRNLLENAVKYSPAGTHGVGRAGPAGRRVADLGPG